MRNRINLPTGLLAITLILLLGCNSTEKISKSKKDPSKSIKKSVSTPKVANALMSSQFPAPVAAGSNYYVATDAPNANDKNPGTEAKPFKSIRGCLIAIRKKLKPGDNIWIKNGEYRCENLRLSTKPGNYAIVLPSGESYDKMISIMAYPGHKPLINQSSLVKNWKSYKGKIWVVDYVSYKYSFPVTFADGEVLQQIGGTVRNNPEYWRGKKGETVNDMEPGSFFYDEKNTKLYVWLKDGGDPNQHKMEAYGQGTKMGRNCFTIIGLKYIKVSGLTIRYGGIGFAGSHGILSNVDQSWSGFGGCHLGGEFNTVVNCKFNHNGNNGMGGRGRGHRIIDCETSYNNYRDWSNGWHSGGVKFIPMCHDWVLKGHVASYNNGDGIWFDWGMSNVTIEGCRSFRNKGAGIHYEIGSRGVIKNNICYENGARGIYLSNAAYCLVMNNLCYRNTMSGVVSIGVKRGGPRPIVRGTGIMPGGHNVIMGNIMVDNCDAVGLLKLYKNWPLSANFKRIFGAHYEKFKDWAGRPELIVPDPRDEPANQGTYSDYNIFYRSGKRGDNPESLPFAYNWDIAYARGLKDWSKKTGLDKNSIFAEPKFKDLANYDFHPATDCPSQWFMSNYDIGLMSDFDSQARPRKALAQTAGPYVGDLELQKKLVTGSVEGKYSLIPIMDRKPQWRPGRFIALSLAKKMGVKELAKMQLGYKVDGIPFANPSGAEKQIYFGKLNSKTCVVKPNRQAKELYFLFTVEANDKPFVNCVIQRDDGVKITFAWQPDGKGGFTTNPTKNLVTKKVAEFQVSYLKKDKKKRAVYMTTWKNENEWLPISKITFDHLDKESNFALLGITAENLK